MGTSNNNEPAELQSLRIGLDTLTTDAHSIQAVSAQMRGLMQQNLQAHGIRLWLNQVHQCTESTSLLALIYLANDVIQLLRGTEQSVCYRYNFAPAFAEAIVIIRQRAVAVMPKVQRVIEIFQKRLIYDSCTLSLMLRLLEAPLNVCKTSLLPLVYESMLPPRLDERIQQFEMEKQKRSQQQSIVPLVATSSGNVVAAVHVDPPSLEELIEASKVLEQQFHITQRSPYCVNLDAQVISRVRGYRVPLSARILDKDFEFIQTYEQLLKCSRENQISLEEKLKRRQREETEGQFLLVPEIKSQMSASLLTVSKRVEILLKKEWNLRCEKQQVHYTIFWYLVTLLDQMIQRLNYIHSIAEAIDTEMSRRKTHNNS